MAKRICIIEHFIIPSLKNKTFGKLLEWDDEENGVFRLRWSHKSASKWKKNNFDVFTTWDLCKGRTNETDENYYTNSKGRFRSALNRLKSKVAFIKSKEKSKYRYYQLKKYKKNEEYNFEYQTIKIDEQDQLSPSSVCSQSSGFCSENELNFDYQQQSIEMEQISPSSGYCSENEHNSIEYEKNCTDVDSNSIYVSYNKANIQIGKEVLEMPYQSNFSQRDLYTLHSDEIFSTEEFLFENKDFQELLKNQGINIQTLLDMNFKTIDITQLQL